MNSYNVQAKRRAMKRRIQLRAAIRRGETVRSLARRLDVSTQRVYQLLKSGHLK